MTAELTNHKGPQDLGPFLVSNVGMRADDHGAITSHGVRLGWSIAIAALLTLYAAPGMRDPEPPWDRNRMARDIAQDLKRYEGLRGELERVDVLAWRHAEKEAPPVPMRRYFVDIALVWGRTATSPPGWILVQTVNQARGADLRWQRSFIWRYLRSPLTHLRPGEAADGTWRAYAPYDHPPTSREICAFAAVSFLAASGSAEFQTTSSGLRLNTWLALTGSEPACDMAPVRAR